MNDWDLVQYVFERGEKCEDCPHLTSWDEYHPYGSTYAAERLCECKLGTNSEDAPEMCPGFASLKETISEELSSEMGMEQT